MNLRSIFILSLFIGVLSCSKDDDIISADLFYDSSNFDAPDLTEGTHEAAARFPKTFMTEFNGRTLESVEYFIQEIPNSAKLIVYGEGDAVSPGQVLYETEIITEMDANSWNTHSLSTPVDLTGEDIWLVIRVYHNSTFGSVGCDPGPANSNGDWLFSERDGEWLSLRERSNNITSINWNIRGYVSN